MLFAFFTRIAILAVLVLCMLLAFYAYVVYQTKPYIFTSPDTAPSTSVAMVLGASVTSTGELSDVLKERADMAIVLYNAGKVKKILVTGDNATLAHNEVDPVGKYLVAQGIPKQDVFLDHAGFDTYSSMYRARDVFKITNLTIVSQEFHLPRAVYIARSLGLLAYAVPAKQQGWLLYNYVREVPAIVKAEYDLQQARQPKFLGTQYPIWGDGSPTWSGFDLLATSTAWGKIQIWK